MATLFPSAAEALLIAVILLGATHWFVERRRIEREHRREARWLARAARGVEAKPVLGLESPEPPIEERYRAYQWMEPDPPAARRTDR